MSSEMAVVVGPGGSCLATYATDVRLFSRVNLTMKIFLLIFKINKININNLNENMTLGWQIAGEVKN